MQQQPPLEQRNREMLSPVPMNKPSDELIDDAEIESILAYFKLPQIIDPIDDLILKESNISQTLALDGMYRVVDENEFMIHSYMENWFD